MELVGRDKIVQNGNNSSIKVDNKKVIDPKRWYQTTIGQISIGIIIIVIGAIITKIIGIT